MGAFISLGLLNVLWMLPMALFMVIWGDDHGMHPYLKSAGKFMLVICGIIIFITIMNLIGQNI